MLHHLLVAAPVGLGAQRVYCRALAEVEHAVLDAGFVCRLCHLSAEGVQFPHQMALARAADGGVAGHVAHAVEIDREAHGVKPQARRGQGGFDPGVSRAYDRHVASARVISNQLQTPRFLEYIVLFYHPAPAESNTNPFQEKFGKSFFMIILDHPSRESYNYSV